MFQKSLNLPFQVFTKSCRGTATVHSKRWSRGSEFSEAFHEDRCSATGNSILSFLHSSSLVCRTFTFAIKMEITSLRLVDPLSILTNGREEKLTHFLDSFWLGTMIAQVGHFSRSLFSHSWIRFIMRSYLIQMSKWSWLKRSKAITFR